MQDLLPRATEIAALLKERRETLAIAESSTGGLVSAALLATPGASAFFLGSAVIYTRTARQALLGITEEMMAGMRPATEAYALLLARTAQRRFEASWSLGETGATGPAGNRYGDPPGHAWIALTGPSEQALRIETGSGDRVGNMRVFAAAALDMLHDALV